MLGRPPLVGRQDVGITREALDGGFHAQPAFGAGVALVAPHDGAPLVGAHGGSAAVGQQVDNHFVGMQEKRVVLSILEKPPPFVLSGQADLLHYFDAKGFDRRLVMHAFDLVRKISFSAEI